MKMAEMLKKLKWTEHKPAKYHVMARRLNYGNLVSTEVDNIQGVHVLIETAM